ncbi:cobalamin biosynthesis protein [Desulfuromonas thiophila]|uniref:cobalamin biosynthesis protein n=1 Tax=Desulfuromonas thiophila TaxID=57664 RepID=UPI0024A87D53|nr:cobalamin biosynthesis protein [Desulfuromonas thiophila]
MTTAVITFSPQGLKVMQRIAAHMAVDQYLHQAIAAPPGVMPFERVVALTGEIFSRYDGLVYVAPCGVVVRAIAPLVDSKLRDPAVVCLDVGARHAMSVLSGHEGGANDLAIAVANVTGAEPVISTTTEAVKDLIVGIGCRKGKSAADIFNAVTTALAGLDLPLERVRFLATADVKAEEAGLLEAAAQLNIPLRVIDSDLIRHSTRPFGHSEFVASHVQLPAVSEPAALLAGRRTTLLLQKKAFNGITIAIARENCPSLA